VNIAEALEQFDSQLYQEMGNFTKKGANAYELKEIAMSMRDDKLDVDVELPNDVKWALMMAVDSVRTRIGVHKVEPWSFERAVENLNLDTGAGFSFPNKKKGDVLDDIKKGAKDIITSAKIGKQSPCLPTLLGTRGHLRDVRSKSRRMINVVPAEQVLVDSMFAGPIYEDSKKLDGLMYLGKGTLRKLRDDSMKGFAGYEVKTDLVKLDRKLQVPLMDVAFGIVHDKIDFEHWNGNEVRPSEVKRWNRVFDASVEYTLHTPIMCPDGDVFYINGGMPSGSSWTQLIDTICMALMILTAVFYFGYSLIDLKVLGDDARLRIGDRPRLEELAAFLKEWFYAELSVKKTSIQSGKKIDRGFIGYKFRGTYPFRETIEWFSMAFHTERENTDIGISYSRLIAFMHLGGVRDTKFSDFFMFFQSGFEIPDEYLTLTYDLKAKRDYAGLDIEVKKLAKYTLKDFCFKLTL